MRFIIIVSLLSNRKTVKSTLKKLENQMDVMN